MTRWRRRLDHASRIAATGACFAAFGVACIIVGTVVFPLIRLTSPGVDATRRRVRRCVSACYRFFIGMGRVTGMLSYELHGCERLARPGQLVVANHPSLIDVLFLASWMPEVDCIVKDALLRNPFLRAPIRWAGYIPNGAAEDLIEDCAATLRNGNSLLVFPEGTRSVPGAPLAMKRGAAHIALAAGCDLLPVTIRCNPSSLTKADVWYRVPPRRPHWCITVGEPIGLRDLVVAGEPESRSARRVTAHLVEYFSRELGLPVAQPSTPSATLPAPTAPTALLPPPPSVAMVARPSPTVAAARNEDAHTNSAAAS